jgi:Copper type II ascorbate-dependent monooxygenase, C-terminal domain
VNLKIRNRRRWLVALTVVPAVALVAACSSSGARTSVASSSGASATRSGTATAAAPLRAGERFETLQLPQPYTPAAPNGGTDEYRCFVLDPRLTSMNYLTGSQFVPQNAQIVHHAIVYRVAPERASAVRAIDARTPGEGWTCFGNDGVGDSAWVGHWAPGVKETPLTDGVGYPMPPGSLLVLQVHYNLLGTGGPPVGSDRSGIRLRLSDRTAGMKPLDTALLPAPIELPCASGESGPLCDRTAAIADVTRRFGADVGGQEARLVARCGHGAPPVPGNTQHCDHPVPQPVTVYAAAGHMHLLGRSIKIEVNPGTAGARTLLDVPAYNFDDQSIQPLATPVTLKPGDTLRVTCTHDAGLRRQLPELSELPPRYVVWGDGTSDEMCLGLLAVTPGS